MSLTVPLSAWSDWTADPIGVLAVAASAGYLVAGWRCRRGDGVPVPRRIAFHFGCLGLFVLSCGPLTHYATELFWVRALQITVLLYLVPLALASGTPLTAIGAALPAPAALRGIAALRSRPAHLLTHPAVASGLLLAVPWILIFTGWNVAAMRHGALDAVTRLILLMIGGLYFWTRIQADPVPRRWPQGLSLLVTLVESIGDGILGVVVWLGPVLYTGYYAALGFTDADALRTSQTIGAGMLWILADVIGVPFLMILLVALRREDTATQARVDAAQDAAEAAAPVDDAPPAGLWWEQDPRLRDRFRG